MFLQEAETRLGDAGSVQKVSGVLCPTEAHTHARTHAHKHTYREYKPRKRKYKAELQLYKVEYISFRQGVLAAYCDAL